MKIVHICLGCFYPDGFSYQENMLPKFHKELGYNVEVIASLLTFDTNGKSTLYPEAKVYKNEYGIQVTRLNYKKPKIIYQIIRRFDGFREALFKSNPDIIFVHGCQFSDIDIIVEYAKMHQVKIYIDNHADFSNSARNWLSRIVLHGMLWRHCAHIIYPYVKKYYGVLPVRVDFLTDVYKIPKKKCELLVMGADDELVKAANELEVRENIRKMYNIAEDEFLIITGGKIDQWKTETLLLMKAVKNINAKVKLIVFGSVIPELKEEVNSLVDGNKIQYIGWIRSEESYSYFAASDLVVFPGRHSVMWEQATGQGIPMLVKDWVGTHHVDLGGNVKFLKENSVDEIKRNIEFILEHPEEYKRMKKIAVEKGMKIFSYKDIAKRSIED